MEVVLVVVGAVAGASVKWAFDRLADRRRDRRVDHEKVVAARHQALEAAQALQVEFAYGSPVRREVLLAATQGVSRLAALGDVTGATRAMQCLLALELHDEDLRVEAQTDFVTHINDPVRVAEARQVGLDRRNWRARALGYVRARARRRNEPPAG